MCTYNGNWQKSSFLKNPGNGSTAQKEELPQGKREMLLETSLIKAHFYGRKALAFGWPGGFMRCKCQECNNKSLDKYLTCVDFISSYDCPPECPERGRAVDEAAEAVEDPLPFLLVRLRSMMLRDLQVRPCSDLMTKTGHCYVTQMCVALISLCVVVVASIITLLPAFSDVTVCVLSQRMWSRGGSSRQMYGALDSTQMRPSASAVVVAEAVVPLL